MLMAFQMEPQNRQTVEEQSERRRSLDGLRQTISRGFEALHIVLVRNTVGQRPDQIFYCSDLKLSARQILATYAGRWSIEVTFKTPSNCSSRLLPDAQYKACRVFTFTVACNPNCLNFKVFEGSSGASAQAWRSGSNSAFTCGGPFRPG
jgi:hypothetical protein